MEALALSNIETLRQEGIDALTQRLGPIGMVNFIRLFENGRGDYTTERQDTIANITPHDFLAFIAKDIEPTPSA